MYDLHYPFISPHTWFGIITLLPYLIPRDQLFSTVFFPSPIESLHLLYVPQNNALTRKEGHSLQC